MPSRTKHAAAEDTPLTQPAHDRVLAVAKRLRTALRRALEEGVPPPHRMKTLCDVLSIDKTLASRITRAAAAAEPLAALALGPGAGGYLLLCDRLRVRTPESRAVEALVDAVVALQRAYEDFPDGRRGFEAALAGWLPQNRAAGERRARQQIYQATLFLMGVEIDVSYSAYVYAPSATSPTTCDLSYVEVRQDVRRARVGARAGLTGVPYTIPGTGATSGEARIETLDGRTPTDDGSVALLREFCSDPLPHFSTMQLPGALLLVAAGDVPAIGERLTAAVGVVGRNIANRFALAGGPAYAQNRISDRRPIRMMVVDVLVAEELKFGAPVVTVSASNIASVVPRAPDEDDMTTIPQELAFESLGAVSSGQDEVLKSDEVRGAQALIERAIGAMNPRPRSFQAYRLHVEYPIPHARHTIWLALPPG